jgi:transcription antitermination protein NusB
LVDKDYPKSLALNVVNNIDKLDDIIQKSAVERPVAQISTVDRNVLRVGLYELLFDQSGDVPPKVAINEAVELAKNFGGEKSSSFINGVLGTVYKTIQEVKPEEDLKKE